MPNEASEHRNLRLVRVSLSHSARRGGGAWHRGVGWRGFAKAYEPRARNTGRGGPWATAETTANSDFRGSCAVRDRAGLRTRQRFTQLPLGASYILMVLVVLRALRVAFESVLGVPNAGVTYCAYLSRT